MKKKSEVHDAAVDYADSICGVYQGYTFHDAVRAYEVGYTQALKDLITELEQYDGPTN